MRRPALVLAAVMLALGGCDSGGGFGPPPSGIGEPSSTATASSTPSTPGVPRVLRVSTPGYRYEPVTLTLRPMESVVLELQNPDTRVHNLTVDELNIQMTVNPGETVRLPLEGPARGSFDMYCSIAGHLQSGHRGRLEVR